MSATTTLHDLCDDLRTETDELDGMIEGLDAAGWATPTPAAGWDVREQISHLAWSDEMAALAIADPARFEAEAKALLTTWDMTQDVERGRALSPSDVDRWFHDVRDRMLKLIEPLDPKQRIVWFGPPMTPPSFVTARLMETWAHAQDIADALGICRVPTDRLRHVAFLGVRTLPWSYTVHGHDAPDVPVHVSLRGPGGEVWTFGDETAADRVEGDAEDFCMVVTQRRNAADTGLRVSGAVANEWMQLAQVYAGLPSRPRPAADR